MSLCSLQLHNQVFYLVSNQRIEDVEVLFIEDAECYPMIYVRDLILS